MLDPANAIGGACFIWARKIPRLSSNSLGCLAQGKKASWLSVYELRALCVRVFGEKPHVAHRWPHPGSAVCTVQCSTQAPFEIGWHHLQHPREIVARICLHYRLFCVVSFPSIFILQNHIWTRKPTNLGWLAYWHSWLLIEVVPSRRSCPSPCSFHRGHSCINDKYLWLFGFVRQLRPPCENVHEIWIPGQRIWH